MFSSPKEEQKNDSLNQLYNVMYGKKLQMFSKSQLTLLIELQSEDWHPYYFQYLVKESGEKDLTEYVDSLNFDQVQSLQLALDLLAGLPLFNPQKQEITP